MQTSKERAYAYELSQCVHMKQLSSVMHSVLVPRVVCGVCIDPPSRCCYKVHVVRLFVAESESIVYNGFYRFAFYNYHASIQL